MEFLYGVGLYVEEQTVPMLASTTVALSVTIGILFIHFNKGMILEALKIAVKKQSSETTVKKSSAGTSEPAMTSTAGTSEPAVTSTAGTCDRPKSTNASASASAGTQAPLLPPPPPALPRRGRYCWSHKGKNFHATQFCDGLRPRDENVALIWGDTPPVGRKRCSKAECAALW